MQSLYQQYEELLIDSKFNMEGIDDLQSKISTRQEIIDDLLKQLHKIQEQYTTLETHSLREEVKANNQTNALLHKELIQLSEQNSWLRNEHKRLMNTRGLKNVESVASLRCYQSCKNSDKQSQQQFRFYHQERQSFNSIKPNNKENLCLEQNRMSEIYRPNRQHQKKKSEYLSSVKKRPMMTSMENSFFMKREEEELHQAPAVSHNIYLHFINLMLIQEKQLQKALFESNNAGISNPMIKSKCYEIKDLQQILKKSQGRIDEFIKAIGIYKKNIAILNEDIEGVDSLIRQFTNSKQRIQLIIQKIENIPVMLQEIENKKIYVKQYSVPQQPIEQPDSIRLFIQLFSEQQKTLEGQATIDRLKKIRNDCSIFTIDKKQAKIKQLVDSIKQGRKKFLQICSIYTERIRSLEEKITNG